MTTSLLNRLCILSLGLWILPHSDIRWSKNFKVRVSDFQSPVNYNEGFANISTGFSCDYIAQNETGYTLDIYAFMTPDSSFMSRMPDLIWTDSGRAVLNHEQRHFDITEVNTRYFKKVLRSYKFRREQNVLIDSLYNIYQDKMIQMQNLYDKETENGGLDSMQTKWDFKIDSILRNTSQFEETRVLLLVH